MNVINKIQSISVTIDRMLQREFQLILNISTFQSVLIKKVTVIQLI